MKAYTALICQLNMRFLCCYDQNGGFRMWKRKFIRVLFEAFYLPV